MFACKWRDAFFGTGVQAQRSLGFGMRVGGGMNWVVDGILWVYPGVMLPLPSSRLLWKATVGGLVVSWPLGSVD